MIWFQTASGWLEGGGVGTVNGEQRTETACRAISLPEGGDCISQTALWWWHKPGLWGFYDWFLRDETNSGRDLLPWGISSSTCGYMSCRWQMYAIPILYCFEHVTGVTPKDVSGEFPQGHVELESTGIQESTTHQAHTFTRNMNLIQGSATASRSVVP